MDTANTVDLALNHYRVPKMGPGYDEDLTYSLHCLWTTFWGKAVPTAPIWDLEMLQKELRDTEGRLVVLEQYPFVLDRLRALRQPTAYTPFGGMLITGSPGIGKTCCLWYLLIVHLCKAEPVVLVYRDEPRVFTGSGIYALTAETVQVLETKNFRNVLCLVDMDAKGSSLRPKALFASRCFTVAASSPQRENYHAWVKQCRIATVVLDAPSKKDLGELIPQSINRETLDRLLNIFGPNIRALVPAIRSLPTVPLETVTERHVNAIRQSLEASSKTELQYLLTRPDYLHNPFLHTLVYTYGREVGGLDQAVMHRIRTPLVLRLLLQLIQQSRLTQLRDMYDVFSATSGLAISRGWAFEVLCHAKICEMDELVLHPLSEHENKLKKTDGASPVHVSIGKPRMEIYTAGSKPETTLDTKCYYVPAERNNPTFDSFIPGEASLALQMTIGRTHTFKKEGVTMFRQRLMAFDQDRDWKINKMKFAFVVPTGHAFSVPITRLDDVDFFVLELDVGDDYEFYVDENYEDDVDDSDVDMDDEEVTA